MRQRVRPASWWIDEYKLFQYTSNLVFVVHQILNFYLYLLYFFQVRPSSSTSNERISNGFTGSQKTVDDEEYNTKVCEPKEELQYLSQVLGFHVTYTDFPQKANNKANTAVPEFITLVKLSTKPPKVRKPSSSKWNAQCA